MHRTWKKLLALMMVTVLLVGSGSMPQTLNVNASEQESEAGNVTSEKVVLTNVDQNTQDKVTEDQEETKEGKNKNSDNASGSSAEADKNSTGDETDSSTEEEKNSKESEKDSEDSDANSKKEGTETQDSGTNTKKDGTESASESEKKSDADSDTTVDESTSTEGTSEESSTESDAEEASTEELLYFTVGDEPETLLSGLGPHNVDMPDLTSHYFLLQKQSQKVSAASGANLKVVGDANEASSYIYNEIPNGSQYTFTPKMTSSTTVTVGGGNGGYVGFDTVKASNRDRFGDIYDMVNSGRIQSCVFNLASCSVNPYAIYTNVGTWYDTAGRKTYSVDMKLTVEGYNFPSESIRNQLNNKYTAPYVAFNSNMIGITVMGTDCVQTNMTFYYHGTGEPIHNLRGVIQFCDIDAQQGVDFGGGFQKIIMFNTSESHLQYSPDGLISGGSLGYVSSRTVANIQNGNTNTTALGVFAGSAVNIIWTVAKCDHKDTGGSAAYARSDGYGVPADSSQSEAISYYYSNSTGFLGIYTDVGLIPLPPTLEKNEYSGGVDASRSTTNQKNMSLSDREEEITFVISAPTATPSDFAKARYSIYKINDLLEAAFEVKQEDIRVYTEQAIPNTSSNYTDVTSWFNITATEQDGHTTLVSAETTSAILNNEVFYGRTLYLHIPVSIRSEEKLAEYGLSLSNWYQEDNSLGEYIGSSNSYRGVFGIGNEGQIYVLSNIGTSCYHLSDMVGVRVPMRVLLRKYGDKNNSPVEGVTFGLFGGKAEDYTSESEPILTAVSDKDGYVCFEAKDDSFFQESYGDGPYHIRELSIPDLYKDVFSPSIQSDWAYEIPSLKDVTLLENVEELRAKVDKGDDQSAQYNLWNTPKTNKKNSVRVYKKSADTGELLQHASFTLYEWSAKDNKYKELMELKEGRDNEGKVYYYNEKEFSNSLDNLGRYKVEETKAPEGCLLDADAWEFTMGEDKDFSSYTFEDKLQKIRLEIKKEGENGEALSGVTFRVKAAENIYAPWAENADNNEETDSSEEKTDASNKESSLLLTEGTVVDIITSDDNGIAKSSENHELYAGKYILEEIKGAKDYVCRQEAIQIQLKNDEDIKEAVKTYSMTVSNDKMSPSMAVAKIADHTINASGECVAFDKTSGRYSEDKIEGTYESGETVDYTITVTNTGNVPLYDLKLTDSMNEINEEEGYALVDFVDEDSSGFYLPEEGYYASTEGAKIKVSYEDENPMILKLEELAVGDSVEVHFMTKVKEGAANAFHLKNDVILSARYENLQGEEIEAERIDVPTENLLDDEGNSLVEDWDFINIPGSALAKVAKLANKTEGATLENGRYKGEKVEGVYDYGENVDFTITVSNAGTADLYQILVKDTPAASLMSSLVENSISFKEGTYKTSLGEEVHAVLPQNKEDSDQSSTYSLLLDELKAGDSVELHLTAQVKSGVSAAKGLKNSVQISAEYQVSRENFQSLEETPEMKDDDTIGIGLPLLSIAKAADKTTGATLKDGRYTGTKNAGSYQAGETILFTLTVSNTGTACAHNVKIAENPTEKLKNYVTPIGYQLQNGQTLTTAKGKTVTVTSLSGLLLIIDQLPENDSLTLIYECRVKENIEKVTNLVNEVKVTGENPDGSLIPERPEMQDEDAVNLTKTTNKTSSAQSSGSNPKTGDNSNTAYYIIMMGAAFLGLSYLLARRKRRL